MARKQSAKPAPPPADFSPDEVNRVLDESLRQGKLASEYAGNKGAVMKNGAEKLGVAIQALSTVHRLDKKLPAKRDVEVADFLRLAEARGFFDQTSLDGTGARETLIDIAKRVGAREPEPSRSEQDDRAALDSIIHH